MITIGNAGMALLAQDAVRQTLASSETVGGELVSPVLSLVNYQPGHYLAPQPPLWAGDAADRLHTALLCVQEHNGKISTAHGVATILFPVSTLRDFLTVRQIQAAVMAAMHPEEVKVLQTIAPIATSPEELGSLVSVAVEKADELEPRPIEREHLAADLSMLGEQAMGHKSDFFRRVYLPAMAGQLVGCNAWREILR